MQKLFKNACLVDIIDGNHKFVDILVDNDKIVQIGQVLGFQGEVEDLEKAFVMAPFVNAFCNSFKAFENSYGLSIGVGDAEIVAKLFFVKNILAGAVFVNDVSIKNEWFSVEEINYLNPQLIDNIAELDEKELSLLSEQIVYNKTLPFIKFGQTLFELGTIDKLFGKTATQVLEDFGFLDRKHVIIGANCLEKDELRLLKSYESKIVLTPYEDGRVGRRSSNLVSLLGMDFDIGFGSGGIFEVDFFAYMRQVLMSQRAMFENTECIDEKSVLNIATNGGARTLGFKNKIEVGAFANFIVVDNKNSINDDILKTIFWGKSKRDVLMTVMHGRVLQKNGKILMKNMYDYDTLISEIGKLRRI